MSDKSGKSGVKIAIISIVSALLFCVLTAAVAIATNDGGFYDSAAVSGQITEISQQEIDALAAGNTFNISMVPHLVFSSKDGEALANIQNSRENRYDMSVDISLEDGRTIYSSGGIRPGEYIADITLSDHISSGEYQAKAVFTAYDTVSHEKAGQSALEITIEVLG